ncbi:MAG: dienelactone hydrolase family protein [Pseudomonadota bacterium]
MIKNILIAIAVIGLLAPPATAQVIEKVINYQHGGTALQGVLAYDDATTSRRPGVLVVHEWWGMNDYVKQRVRQLAELGFVAFALDMYGKGRVTEHPRQASEWMKETTKNVAFWQDRANAGLAVLRSEERTDPERIAAIGYCFGGATVQQLAYSGAPLKGVVSFHGTPIPPPADAAARVKAAILINHGAADPFIKPEQVQAYLAAMTASGLNWEMNFYGGARHGFTNPGAGDYGLPALAYDRTADERSWAGMRQFFQEIFR